jgi:exosome complex component RRP4
MSAFSSSSIVLPGQVITSESQQPFLRGHGTYIESRLDAETNVNTPHLIASVAGLVSRVNMLISVIPVTSGYGGQVGDLVIGRVIEVASKRWRVEVGASRDAALLLSAVNLPGGAQVSLVFECCLLLDTAADWIHFISLYTFHHSHLCISLSHTRICF